MEIGEDIEYTRRNLTYKIEKLQNKFLVRKTEIENEQALISLTESRMQKSSSLSSSGTPPQISHWSGQMLTA